jgi:hypothetical protein
MGGHANSCQALLLFQVVDFVGQSCHLGEFEWGGLSTPSSLEHGEAAYKGREVGFMVLAIKPGPMRSRREVFIGRLRKPVRGWV